MMSVSIKSVLAAILIALIPSFGYAATATLQVKIDNANHDCRFLPSLSGVPEGVGVKDVKLELFENATKQYSFQTMHKIFDEPLAVGEFLDAFSDFKKMPDGFFADGVGYYHTIWHYYQLTVVLTNGNTVSVKSRPFRVAENPLHMFCAQLVTEPYKGTFTYKPGSTTVYQVLGTESGTGKFTDYKLLSNIKQMPDVYSNWVTSWTDSAFIYAKLPAEAQKASAVRWRLWDEGGLIDTIDVDDRSDFAYNVRVDHFGAEKVLLRLDYVLKNRDGADSTVTMQNFQIFKMRLPTPYFAYADAVSAVVNAEDEGKTVTLEPGDFSGLASGVDLSHGVMPENARVYHLDMTTPLQVAPNMFDKSDVELQITVTDVKNPDDPAHSVSHTYGPFRYDYNNSHTAIGSITLKNVRPSDWFEIDGETGAVKAVKHRILVTYKSGTHEFYDPTNNDASNWVVNPYFGTPSVVPGKNPERSFSNFEEGGWHECLGMGPLKEYDAPSLILNNRTCIPEQSGGNETEYYAVSNRWIKNGVGGEMKFGGDAGSESPSLVSGDLLMGDGNGRQIALDAVQCGDGTYSDNLFDRDWIDAEECEIGVGRVYFFAVDDEPRMELQVDSEVLPVADAPLETMSSRAVSGQHVEAFVPAMSSNRFSTTRTASIDGIMKDDGVTAGEGYIDSGNSEAMIYDLQGMLVKCCKGKVTMNPGIYIAVTSKGAKKVLVL